MTIKEIGIRKKSLLHDGMAIMKKALIHVIARVGNSMDTTPPHMPRKTYGRDTTNPITEPSTL